MSSGGGGDGTPARAGSSVDFLSEELSWIFGEDALPMAREGRRGEGVNVTGSDTKIYGGRNLALTQSQVETIQKLRQDRAQRLQASRAAQAASTRGQMPTPTTTSTPSSTGSRSAAPATMRDIERQTETQFLGV